MTFCDSTIYNSNPLLIRLYTELDLLPILSGFHRIFATGVACREGTLLLKSIPFPNLSLFYGLCSSNIPRDFLDFSYNLISDFLAKLFRRNSINLTRMRNTEMLIGPIVWSCQNFFSNSQYDI